MKLKKSNVGLYHFLYTQNIIKHLGESSIKHKKPSTFYLILHEET